MKERSPYTARINRVMDHIDAHLDETLDLQALVSGVSISPHRSASNPFRWRAYGMEPSLAPTPLA